MGSPGAVYVAVLALIALLLAAAYVLSWWIEHREAGVDDHSPERAARETAWADSGLGERR